MTNYICEKLFDLFNAKVNDHCGPFRMIMKATNKGMLQQFFPILEMLGHITMPIEGGRTHPAA